MKLITCYSDMVSSADPSSIPLPLTLLLVFRVRNNVSKSFSVCAEH